MILTEGKECAVWGWMLACDLLIPCLMIGFGWMFWKYPPKTINGVYGYRTRRSMKNAETWEFAHRYCGKIWLVTGLCLLPVAAAVQLRVIGKEEDVIRAVGLAVCLLELIPLTLPILPTELALKRTFDDDGHRRPDAGTPHGGGR